MSAKFPRGGGGGRTFFSSKSTCCCICDSISFDVQHNHVMKKLNFDPNHRVVGAEGRGTAGKLSATMLLHS